jgi:hypothetical protein
VLHPRPLHLAWNGLTLPADDPFWRTHGPPNGWGCKCFLVGARDAKGARRVGGDPDKTIDPAWNEVSPKTGEPVGIDRGWGYLPGDTVADTVSQMAAKTLQWDYTLAKAYMQGVPEGVRDTLARAYRDLPSVADATRRYAARVLDGKTEGLAQYHTLGLLTSEDARRVAGLKKLDVSGYDYALDRDAVGHVRIEHGEDAVEVRRGQRAVTAADYRRLPAILNAPDAVEDAGASRIGTPLVRFVKKFGAEEYVAVFGVRRGRRMLGLQTMWIRSGTPPR